MKRKEAELYLLGYDIQTNRKSAWILLIQWRAGRKPWRNAIEIISDKNVRSLRSLYPAEEYCTKIKI